MYLNQEQKQKMLVTMACKCTMDNLCKEQQLPNIAEARVLFYKAAQLIYEGYKVMNQGIDDKQRDQIERACLAQRMWMIPTSDPRLSEHRYYIDEQNAKTLHKMARENQCAFCCYNEPEARKCELRRILKEDGEQGEGLLHMGWCEYS